MVSTRSDASALEHILGVLLEEPPIIATDSVVPNFQACLKEAGVTCASDFLSIDPSAYAAVPFSVIKDGTDKDTNLNVIQIKKLSALVSWFRQTPASPAVHWFDLSEDAFRTWRVKSIIPAASTPVTATT